MPNGKLSLLTLTLTVTSLAGACSAPPKPEATGQAPAAARATPTPILRPNAKAPEPGNAYHIKGMIDEAAQEGDVCDVTVPFTVDGTLKFEFKPESPTKGKYTYSGPFNATGSGPYEIFDNGKMLVSGKGCIMGGHCAEYSHDWTAKPIDPKDCGKKNK